MKPFEVYSLLPIEPIKALGAAIWDKEGKQYLDFYGGHAVISIGHNNEYYVNQMKDQLDKIIFYSNSVQIPLQQELAIKLGKMSGYEDYSLFLCNSGAEAIENALKLASFHTQKKKVIAFQQSFHGRTSAAVAITDNPAIQATINQNHEVAFLKMNDIQKVQEMIAGNEVAAVIIEGIQGVGGIHVPNPEFLKQLESLCKSSGVILIVDEIQSGYGRTGKFFAHQHAGIRPDLITTAKGMGNGFPIGGVLISPIFQAKEGMLGTTFGGSHLACRAAIAVLDVLEKEQMIENAANVGAYLFRHLKMIKAIKELRGEGLMIGIEFDFPIQQLRTQLLMQHHIFTGYAGKHTLRLLPPLCLGISQADYLMNALIDSLQEIS